MPPTDEDIAWFKSTFHPIPKAELPDDCVEYSIYLLSTDLDSVDDSEVRNRLRDVQKYASELQRSWGKDYIWQRQGFSLELAKENGASLLQGRTEYGDSVEDEWVIVWILRELTKKFKELWIKITDSDGEFLLIEASGTLPAWLEPEVAENRVWIHNGALVIIRPPNAAKSRRTVEKLTLEDARQIILTQKTRLMKSASIEEEAFYRLRNYPAQIKENMHHSLATIPRKIAYLIRQKPAYIAPAIEAFYLRDPIALKPLQTRSSFDKLIFPPTDLVTVSVKVPRVAFAQLKSQDFPPPVAWDGKIPPKQEFSAFSKAETGMKIACGFEMLVSDSHNQDKAAVREMKMLLDDLETGDETLPTNEDIMRWDKTQDDEKWLDISFEDLEGELAGKSGDTSAGSKGKGKFGDTAAQENLQRIVKQFEDFLNDDKAGAEGAGMFDDDSDNEDMNEDDSDEDEASDLGEDKEASFDEDEFTRMMREMMGMPAEVMREVMAGKDLKRKTGAPDATAPRSGHVEEVEASDSDYGDDEEMKEMMRQMEVELRESGALDLDPSTHGTKASNAIDGSGKGKQTAVSTEEQEETDDSSDDGSENEIDINLARNLLESLKSQAGTAGPGSNIMGMMGLRMPRDEGEGSGRLQDKRK